MARQITEKHKRGHKHKHTREGASPRARHKSSKSSHSHQHRKKSPAPEIQGPSKQFKYAKRQPKSMKTTESLAKQSEVIKKSSKPKKVVSAAGLIKHAKNARHKENTHRKRKEPTPEPTLADGFREDIEEGISNARASIDANLHKAFTSQYEAFLNQLAELRNADVTFFESMNNAATALKAPLSEEVIEVTVTSAGKSVTKAVEIGKRVELFQAVIEKTQGKLVGLWKSWDELQAEYEKLGVEVFGPGFSDDEARESNEDFERAMESRDENFEMELDELTGEVDNLVEEYLTMMRESEKELEASSRLQQSKLLQAIRGG